MENYVPVLTRKRRPLAPCHPNRARSLVAAGKARFHHRHGIRCIILSKTNIPKVKHASRVNININPGANITGIAVTRDHADGARSALITLEVQHRGHTIKQAMLKRAQHRRNRRSRKTGYRQPRFNNRTRPPDWMPPSVKSRLQNTITWLRRLAKLLPTDNIHVETMVYDPQAIRNPEIHGAEYQQGPLYQSNLRAAVLQRDGNQCVYCGKNGKRHRLNLDHVVPQSAGGNDRYDNRVASCVPCNQKKGSQTLEQFLKRRPAKLAEIQAKLGIDIAWAAQHNWILPRLVEELRHDGWNPMQHSAATTAAGRRACNLPKTASNDAAALGCPQSLRYLPDQPICIKATGRGGYQRMLPDAHGTPRGQAYRAYCRLPKHLQRQTPTPGHKKRAKRVASVATGDYVMFHHRNSDAVIHGYGTISNTSVAITQPRWRSTQAKNAVALERNHGYQVHYP